MQFVFRTDASRVIGTGHVMRCLTLAESLHKKGADIFFICREHDGNLCDLIEKRGFIVYRLPMGKRCLPEKNGIAHAAWLGASWEEDAIQTCSIIKNLKMKPDWLIVDHYALDHNWEHTLRSVVKRIFAIDDIADRNHDCDLLLDQNLVENGLKKYLGRVPKECTLLIGPEYALLQPEYSELHTRCVPRNGQIHHILVYFGGSDPENITGLTLETLKCLYQQDICIDVVISPNTSRYEDIKKSVAGWPNITVHCFLPSLAPLMMKADLAIGGSGSTNWERLCLGLPAIVISLADNQRQIAHQLHQFGLVRWIGDSGKINRDIIQNALDPLLIDGLPDDWSLHCHNIVDGKGTERICTILSFSENTQLSVRPVTLSDEDQILSWMPKWEDIRPKGPLCDYSNDKPKKWFRTRIRDIERCKFYIVETIPGIPVGFVSFIENEGCWSINYALPSYLKNRKFDRTLLESAMIRFHSDSQKGIVFFCIGNTGSSLSSGGAGQPRHPPNHPEYRKPLRISICSDAMSWINQFIPSLILSWLSEGYEIQWSHDATKNFEGDICFFLSYGQIVNHDTLVKHKNNLVVHESDLPRGRGWSPLTWQILEGENNIPVTLFEAVESVDSGQIYYQEYLNFQGTELIDELRNDLANITMKLCRQFVDEYPGIIQKGTPQEGDATYYPRRNPEDSCLNIDIPLKDQFNLLRTVDNKKYPAWFKYRNTVFRIKIEKISSSVKKMSNKGNGKPN